MTFIHKLPIQDDRDFPVFAGDLVLVPVAERDAFLYANPAFRSSDFAAANPQNASDLAKLAVYFERGRPTLHNWTGADEEPGVRPALVFGPRNPAFLFKPPFRPQ